MTSVNGIDWLSFSAYFSKSQTIEKHMKGKSHLFTSNKLNFHTRNFSEVWQIFYCIEEHGRKYYRPFATLCCKPQSNILNEQLLTFKLENEILYTDFWYLYLMLFLDEYNIGSLKIQRIDIYRDFQYIPYKKKKADPKDLLRDIAIGKLNKKGKSRYTIYCDSKERGCYAITYGSILSGRQLQIYNKTKELNEVKDKPHIRAMWRDAKFEKELPVYRAEIRICKRGLELFDLETSSPSKLTLQEIWDKDIEPLIESYFDCVAVWYDKKGNKIKPLNVKKGDEIIIPFIPKFYGHVPNPNPANRAKNVLRWAEQAKEELQKQPYISCWYETSKAILSDFIYLLNSTIPMPGRLKPREYDNTNFCLWLLEHTNSIRNYCREYSPPHIPLDEIINAIGEDEHNMRQSGKTSTPSP